MRLIKVLLVLLGCYLALKIINGSSFDISMDNLFTQVANSYYDPLYNAAVLLMIVMTILGIIRILNND